MVGRVGPFSKGRMQLLHVSAAEPHTAAVRMKRAASLAMAYVRCSLRRVAWIWARGDVSG